MCNVQHVSQWVMLECTSGAASLCLIHVMKMDRSVFGATSTPTYLRLRRLMYCVHWDPVQGNSVYQNASTM